MLEPEPEPEPLGLPGAVPMSSLTPPARLPPLQPAKQPRAAKQQRNAKEELARKRLSELCKLARAKDIDQFDIEDGHTLEVIEETPLSEFGDMLIPVHKAVPSHVL